MSIKKDGQEGNATTMIPAQGVKASTPSKPGSPAPLFSKPLPIANDGRTAVLQSPSPRIIDGRYTLLDLLGEGGMGQVYRAQDQQLDEVVALKMLHPDLLSKTEAVHRFKQEARLARRVTHPNVARTFDLGETDGTLYLTMEFVEGESLSDRLKRKRTLPLEETVSLCLAICAGLDAAHQQSIIHRDLKPENILLANDGRAVLTDFGIARLESGDSHFKTAMGVVVGTPTYMAPEQIEGKGKIDARTDLYALGCILFEMLAGSPAWLGNDFIVLATARFMQPPPDVRTRRPDVPEAMAELILRCMARQPDKRFSSAVEVVQALQALTSASIAQPTRTFLTQLPAGGTSTSPRHPTWSTAAGLAALAPQAGQVQVAVLPFQNRGNTTEAHILEGLMDDLIDTLSMTEGLDVRALGMVKSYKGHDVAPTEAGRELGVDVIISGSIQTMGEQLKIRTQLISTHDGNQLWAQRFPCKTSDFFDVSDGIAQEVAKALKVDLSLPQRSVSQNSAAIDLYLRGRYELRRCWTADVTPAIQLFDQARELSPEDPKILSGAAIARSRFAF